MLFAIPTLPPSLSFLSLKKKEMVSNEEEVGGEIMNFKVMIKKDEKMIL